MRRFLSILSLSVFCMALTSCIDILEKINLKKDGSGQYSMSITINENLKGMMTEAMTAALKNPADDEDLPAEDDGDAQGGFKDTFRELENQLKNIKGVSNFITVMDEENFNYGYSFDFDNIETLNKCMEVTAGTSLAKMPGAMKVGKKGKPYTPTARYIEWSKNTLIRHQSAELAKVLEMKKTEGSNAGMMGGLDVGFLFQDMKYICEYTFEQSVKSVSNEAATLADSKQAVVLECKPFAYTPSDLTLAKLQEQACSQAINIQLK